MIVTGTWTTVKEQMAGIYARELANRGLAALAFDFTGWGESGGAPQLAAIDSVALSFDLIEVRKAGQSRIATGDIKAFRYIEISCKFVSLALKENLIFPRMKCKL